MSALLHRVRARMLAATLLASAFVAACDSPSEPYARPPVVPARLALVAGDGQSGPVGEALPVAIALQVLDSAGVPLAGHTVAFRVVAGGGTVAGGSIVTDADGRVAERWTLGTAAGEAQRLEARVAPAAFGAPALVDTIEATALAGTAATVVAAAADSQPGTVGQPVAVSPAVRVHDRYGNRVVNAPVRFRVTAGDGTISDTLVRSDTAGASLLPRWTLGARPGRNTVGASVTGGTEVVFVATAAVGAPAAVEVVNGDALRATVGTALATRPVVRVRDAMGNPIPGQPVHFALLAGGGAVSGTTATTDALGQATIASWTLGTTAGAHTLQARSGELPPVTITATATADVPVHYAFVRGQRQIEERNRPVAEVPRVRLVDRYGNRVPGVPVTFSVISGGGSIGSANVTTDAQGEATPGHWRLGLAEGFNVLGASAPGFPPLSVLARAVPASAFPIEIRYLPGTEPPPEVQQVVLTALARLRKVFVQAPPEVRIAIPEGRCIARQTQMNEIVQGLVIWADLRRIDGPGGNLGGANWCARRVPSRISAVGFLQLDVDDLLRGIEDGTALATVVHEILHVAGYGMMWNELGLLNGTASDPWFGGALATDAFQSSLLSPFSGPGVPVENMGGPGSALVHWRTSLMAPEVMTGFACTGFAPLSYITLSAFLDMGLPVTEYGDDDFEVSLRSCPVNHSAAARFEETPPAPRRYVDERTGALVSEAEARFRSGALVKRLAPTRPRRPVTVESATRRP